MRDTTAPPVAARKVHRIPWRKAAGLAVALVLALVVADFATGAYTLEFMVMPTRVTVVDAQGRALGGVTVQCRYAGTPVASCVTDGRGEVLLLPRMPVRRLHQRLLDVVQLRGSTFDVFRGEEPPPYDSTGARYSEPVPLSHYDIDGAIRWLGIGKSLSDSHRIVVPSGYLGTPETLQTEDEETTQPSNEAAEPSTKAEQSREGEVAGGLDNG